ncbi:MAG: HAMP domain-containing histidine kinase [Dysgonamonadaceae bacterium]|jgi:two-component system phosphate regulon sensor histidine kinase PhoR|nr:HAMP domain-containing histidine kinase [Dysgonamonadaceae bacterium]
MKIKYLFVIFTVAILCLLSFQGIWLYNTYQLKLEEVKSRLNILLIESVNSELDHRFANLQKNVTSGNDSSGVLSFEFNEISDDENYANIISQQSVFLQNALLFYNLPFNIALLDSIYSTILSEANINVNFMLTYKDSSEIIETIGKPDNIDYRTIEVPIVSNNHVYADVKIDPPVVFQQMFGILIASLLMLLILLAILAYQTRYIFTQHRLNRLRENFTHALTHDMRTPLGTIYNVINQLKGGKLDVNPTTREKFCDIANGQVLNLQALVEQILTIAYIEQRELTLNKKPINLEEMISRLTDKFMVKGGKNIKFDTSFALNGEIVYADPLYFENAISNLIDNAIKYSEDSVTVCIECVSNQKMIFVKVRDNGLGISAIDQGKIFERFERGAAVKNKKTSGFGLGLNYVRKVIEAHGGIVALSSKPGEGSEFVIGIPIVVTLIK